MSVVSVSLNEQLGTAPCGVVEKYTEFPLLVAVLLMNSTFNLHFLSDMIALFKYRAPPCTPVLPSKIIFPSVLG